MAAGVLALLLVGLVVRENMARDQGTEVRLALAGYDPRSLLQGHYVQFRMQETFPGRACPPGVREGYRSGKPVWVALRRDGDHHRAAGAGLTRAEAARLGEVTVQGRVSCYPGAGSIAEQAALAAAARGAGVPVREAAPTVTVDVDLGVDRIHLDQKGAEAVQGDLQRAAGGGGPPGYAVLSIGPDGKARVKGLIVGKRRVDLDWW
ncbi:MAG: GDYXXLXY domain-containing protein [Phenylobacterium sp.]|uniref:GDYXXLXY domain-containing protein n=1 Tax=Phenylobacterium sp. TaxID=1871053 RepID=UPI001A513008|nr:GDYXXLXY domain-containing protein [Phenylobacterium sp.]MBL8554107.1 GDYXXLXY domain-containing protein [Phenylobacterium sp.]